jgi:hypothetical protein
VTALKIEKALKIDGPLTDATPVQNSAGRVGRVEFATPLEPATVEGTALRTAVGLRSTWFTLGVMSLASAVPGSIVTYGSPTTLVGTVRGVPGVTLEQRVSGGSWESVGPVASGSPRLVQRPTITTDYRIATPAAAAAFVRVRVAPSVKVTTLTTTLAAGSEQPALPSAPIGVQQQNADATWSTVATGTVNADGTFSLPVQLAAGSSYRVSVGPATGYAAGTSTPQMVVR